MQKGIQEISAFGDRKAKLLEMAQGVLAEKVGQASNQVTAQGAATAETSGAEGVSAVGGKGQVDQARLSDEAVQELQGRGQEGGGVDAMINGLRQIFDQKLAENGQGQTEAAGGAQETKPKKKKKVERKLEWTPATKEGQIHKPRGVIGKAKIKEKVTEEIDFNDQKVNGTKASGSAMGSSKGGGGASAVGGAAGTKGVGSAKPAAQENQQSKKNDDKTQEDKAEISPESANMASKMNAAGVQAPPEIQGQGSGQSVSGVGESKKGQSGGQQRSKERTVFEGDVRTRATGVSQSVDVTPGGELPPGKPFRTFQKLDNMPLLDHATLHGKDGKEFVADHQRRKMRGEAVEPLPEELVQKLKHPIAS